MAQPAIFKTADDTRWLAALARPLRQMVATLAAAPGLPIWRAWQTCSRSVSARWLELADAAVYFYRSLEPSPELKAQHFSAEAKPVIFDLRQKLAVVEWSHAIHEAIKSCAKEHGTAAQGRHASGDGDGRNPNAFH